MSLATTGKVSIQSSKLGQAARVDQTQWMAPSLARISFQA